MKQILINEIDCLSKGHDRYLFSYGRDSDTVKDSINKVGLINPVKLVESHEKYTIVCGSQRIKACQEIGTKSIAAKVVEGLNDEKLLLLSLHDNLFSRKYNEIEKAIAIKKFMEIGYSYDRILAEIAPLLDLPQNKKVVDKYVSLLGINVEIKIAVARSELEMEKAVLLMQLDGAERESVYRALFKESCTNLNETKDTIRNLLDLKLIMKKEINELLASSEINSILSDYKVNKRQKGEGICKIIKTMRYPAISEKEKEFDISCKELGLNNHVRINHSRYFEGNDIQLTIKAVDEENLKADLEKLLMDTNTGKFKKIYNIIKKAPNILL